MLRIFFVCIMFSSALNLEYYQDISQRQKDCCTLSYPHILLNNELQKRWGNPVQEIGQAVPRVKPNAIPYLCNKVL